MSQLLRARRVLTEQGWLDDHQLALNAGRSRRLSPSRRALRS
jgi:N-acetylgalactosamine-6-phosphate deacetylase